MERAEEQVRSYIHCNEVLLKVTIFVVSFFEVFVVSTFVKLHFLDLVSLTLQFLVCQQAQHSKTSHTLKTSSVLSLLQDNTHVAGEDGESKGATFTSSWSEFPSLW